MSDTSQGPGWWQASNGRWYPPQAKAGRAAKPTPTPKVPRPSRGGFGQTPGVQEPFVFRKMEPLGLDREEAKPRRGPKGLNLDRPEHRNTKQWLGLGALIVVSAVVVLVGAVKFFGSSDNANNGDAPEIAVNHDGVRATDAEPAANNDAVLTSIADLELEDSLTSVFNLTTGDCFSPAGDQDDEPVILALVHIFDCEDAHLAEVIKTTTLSGDMGITYPGNAARDAESQRICQDAFEVYVGHTLARSELGLLWLGPTEATWSEQDDRSLTCAVQALDGFPLIGSVENSRR